MYTYTQDNTIYSLLAVQYILGSVILAAFVSRMATVKTKGHTLRSIVHTYSSSSTVTTKDYNVVHTPGFLVGQLFVALPGTALLMVLRPGSMPSHPSLISTLPTTSSFTVKRRPFSNQPRAHLDSLQSRRTWVPVPTMLLWMIASLSAGCITRSSPTFRAHLLPGSGLNAVNGCFGAREVVLALRARSLSLVTRLQSPAIRGFIRRTPLWTSRAARRRSRSSSDSSVQLFVWSSQLHRLQGLHTGCCCHAGTNSFLHCPAVPGSSRPNKGQLSQQPNLNSRRLLGARRGVCGGAPPFGFLTSVVIGVPYQLIAGTSSEGNSSGSVEHNHALSCVFVAVVCTEWVVLGSSRKEVPYSAFLLDVLLHSSGKLTCPPRPSNWNSSPATRRSPNGIQKKQLHG